LAKSFKIRSYANRPILHYFGANKSFRIRSYGHPARNPFRIRSYKNTGGWGCLAFNPVCRKSLSPLVYPDLRGAARHPRPLSLTPFRMNTCRSVVSKRLYLSSESTLMENRGGGGTKTRA